MPLEKVALSALSIFKIKKILLLCKQILSQANYEMLFCAPRWGQTIPMSIYHLSIDFYFFHVTTAFLSLLLHCNFGTSKLNLWLVF